MTYTASLAICAALFHIQTASAENIPDKGDLLPAFELAEPQSPEDRAYLGLTGTGPFSISDIRFSIGFRIWLRSVKISYRGCCM